VSNGLAFLLFCLLVLQLFRICGISWVIYQIQW